jgi:nucleoside-diphosphate-sugar epimerase
VAGIAADCSEVGRIRPEEGGKVCRPILAKNLIESGYSVKILDKFLYGTDSLSMLRDNNNLEIVEGDTRDISDLVPAIKESDSVVHLAELVGDPLCAKDPQSTFEINYIATSSISRICSGLQVNRYIYLSSCSVYGSASNNNDLLDENANLSPVSLYARLKINAGRAILSLENTNFAPCIFRLGTVFGLSYRPRFDLVINALSAKAVSEGKIYIFGGEQWRPHVHVNDVARTIQLALETPLEKVRNQVFNIVGENMRIIDVGKLVKKLMPHTKVFVETSLTDNRNYKVCNAKAMSILKFQPTKKVEDGIREIAEAIRSGTIIDFCHPKYHNYRSQFVNEIGSSK